MTVYLTPPHCSQFFNFNYRLIILLVDIGYITLTKYLIFVGVIIPLVLSLVCALVVHAYLLANILLYVAAWALILEFQYEKVGSRQNSIIDCTKYVTFSSYTFTFLIVFKSMKQVGNVSTVFWLPITERGYYKLILLLVTRRKQSPLHNL